MIHWIGLRENSYRKPWFLPPNIGENIREKW
jgi:hypothetical protein